MFNRILVIGATGLLGRPVVDRLTEGGHSVRVPSRGSEKARGSLSSTTAVRPMRRRSAAGGTA